MNHNEAHRSHRVGWLRAAVLGANDGIVSTASLVIGVAAAHAARGDILLAGVAGLVAGASCTTNLFPIDLYLFNDTKLKLGDPQCEIKKYKE